MSTRRIISRIQNRRGTRDNLPQPLSPGEVAFTTDTRQVWIGADPDVTAPGLVVYVNRSISTAQNIINTKIIEVRFDTSFTQNAFIALTNNLLSNISFNFVDSDFEWDTTLRTAPPNNFEGYSMYIVADQNVNVNHTFNNIQTAIQNSSVSDKLLSMDYVGNISPFGGTFNTNGELSLYSHEQTLILVRMINRVYSDAGTSGGIVRTNLNIEMVAGIGREGLNIDVQPTIGTNTIDESLLTSSLQGRINLIDGPDTLPNSVAQRLLQEALARAAALEAEETARAAAILAEANTRQQEIAAEAATRAQALQDEATARAAAIQAEADARLAGFTAQELARAQALSDEATARAAAIQAEANARAQDVADEAAARTTAIQAEADARAAAITAETNDRISSINNLQTNLQGQVNSLQATVSDLEGTPLFDTNTNYFIDDLVQYEGGLYRAIQDMTAPSPLPTDVAFWEKIGNFTSLAGAVSANSASIADQNTRITTAEGNITATASDVSSLQTDVSGINTTKADITYVDTAVSTEESARVSALSNLETNLQGQINTKASSTDLTTAVSDIYGSQVSAFTNIDARFTSTDNTVATKASQTDIDNAVADVYGAEVSQFTNISAELRTLEESANAIASGTDGSKGSGGSTFTSTSGDFINSNVSAGDVLRITSGGEQGDYPILTVDSATQVTMDGVVWATSEVGLSYTILSPGTIKATRTELNQAVVDVYGAEVSQFTNIQAEFNNIQAPDLSSYATLTNLSTTEANIYGAAVETFTNIDSRFTDVDNAVSSKASITALNNAVSNIYSSEVSQFTNISAQFDVVDTAANAVTRGTDGAKTIGEATFTSAGSTFLLDGVSVGDTLRITSGAEQEDYIILTVDSETQITLNGVSWASTETGVEFAIVTYNQIKATRTDLNNAITDVYGAEVTAFTNINARFTSTDNAVSSKASTTDLTTAVSDIYGSTVDQFTNIDARFTSTDSAIASKATQTDINTAKADVFGSEVTAFTNINARFTSTDSAISSKASTTDLTTAVSNIYGSTVDQFTNIDARFTSTDSAIASKASSTDLTTAISNVYGAQVSAFTNIDARFTSTDSAISSKASTTDLNTAISNVYGAEVTAFTNIDARFTSVEGDVASRATQTQLNTAVSDIYGAEVNQFTNISAELSDFETSLNAISQDVDGAKTVSQATFTSLNSDFIGDGVVAGDTLRITSGTEQGDYVILSVDSATQITLTATLWASSETGLSFSVLSFNKIKATRTELNTAITDVYGAEVSQFANIQAAFDTFDPDLTNTASLTDLDNAKADIYSSQVSQFTNIDAEFNTLDTAINSVGNLADGAKTVGTATFTSASATFTQYGLTAGDTLRITSGTEQGDYTIASIDSDTQLTVGGHTWASTESALTFSVLSYFKVKATRTELSDAVSDVFGAEVTEFTNIDAAFTSVNNDLSSKATQTDIDNAKADVFGASVDQFTNINAEFTNLETGIYSVANGFDGAKTVGGSTFTSATANFVTDGATAGDTLRIEEGAEAGDYTIQTVNSGTQITLTGVTWGSTESALTYSILSFGNIKASRDELNTAIADVYGAEVTAFTNINARFTSTDSAISSKATQTDIDTAKADVFGAMVSSFTNIDARFTSTDTAIASKASSQDVVDAKADVLGSQVSAFANIDARFTSTDSAISSKASTTDLNTAISNVYGAQVSAFTNIDARFTSTDSAIASKATQTDINTAKADVFGAEVTAFTNINARFTSTDSAISSKATQTDIDTAKADVFGATVTSFTNIDARFTSVQGDIDSRVTQTNFSQAISDVYSADVIQFTNINSRFSAVDSNIDAKADITYVNTTTANAEADAIAQATQTIYTDLDGPGATQSSVQTQATAWNGVASQWEVKSTVGDLTAGIGLYNDNGTTRFAVQADNFLVYSASVPPTSADAIPFKVVSGKTYIKEAAIEEVSAGKLTAGTIDAGLTMTGSLVVDTSGFIRSGQTAYNTGTGFWLGNSAGTPRFSIGNSSGNRLTWDGTSLNIVGAVTLTNTIPIGDVSGTGTLATKNSVNLATAEVTNKSLANVDSAANSKLASIDANADVTLAAINGELAVTGGGINLSSGTAAIRSGKTSYASTANGFWVGIDSGTPKFHFGGSTKNIKWTGSDLVLNGEVVETGNIAPNSITASKINVNTLAALDATIGFLENRADGAGTTPYMRLTDSASPIEIFDSGGSTSTRLLGVDTITTDGQTRTVLSIRGTFASNSIADANWLSPAGVTALRSRLGYIPPLNPSGGELSQSDITVSSDPFTRTLTGTITSGGAGQAVIASLKLVGNHSINTSSDPGWVAPTYNVTFRYRPNGGSWTTYGTTQSITGTSAWFPGEPAEGIPGVAGVGISATAAIDATLPGGAPANAYEWQATVDLISGFNLRSVTTVEIEFFTVVEELVGDVQAHNHAATDITTGVLAVARGGTGIGSYTSGNYIRASGSTTLEQRTPAQVRSDIGAGTGTVTSVTGGNGLSGSVSTSGSISMGTPGTITTSTSNSVSSTSHTHAISGVEPTLATNRKRQIFVQSSTPSGPSTGDLWIW